ncbi:MAG: Hpt domain-containing protein, partial [Marinobacter alexandrii]
MAFDADDEILQDFLVEAGEILEKLSEQLVDLEQNPDDSDLLNAIFRGFHTVKGGAGFLQLEALVNCCHSAENVFDILRNHKRKVDSELMDVVLETLDHVNSMFDQVRNGQALTPAPDQLIASLDAFAEPAGETQPREDVPATAPQAADDGGDITDDEFEQLLDALQDGSASPESPAVADEPAKADSASGGGSGDDDITDDEFEALLDQLHGKGQFAGAVAADESAPAADTGAAASGSESAAGGDDLITDDEFEKLLDELHGKGGAPTTAGAGETGTPAAEPAAAPKSDPKKVEPKKTEPKKA